MKIKNLLVLSLIVLVAACSGRDKDAQIDSAVQVGDLGAEGEFLGQGPQGQDGTSYESVELSGPQSGTQEDLNVNVGDRVYFGYDRYDLTQEARAQLEAQANWLRQYPNITVTIEGHADERGTREYNLALGERRANAVRNYLVALGVSPNRVSTISYGKERPVALGSNPESWAQNRRGVTTIN